MSNSVLNTLTITGPNKEVRRFKSQAEGCYRARNGRSFQVELLLSNFKSRVKRKCYYSHITAESDESVTYSFETVGLSITPVIVDMSQNYPLLQFVFRVDELQDFCTECTFQDGKIINQKEVKVERISLADVKI